MAMERSGDILAGVHPHEVQEGLLQGRFGLVDRLTQLRRATLGDDLARLDEGQQITVGRVVHGMARYDERRAATRELSEVVPEAGA